MATRLYLTSAAAPVTPASGTLAGGVVWESGVLGAPNPAHLYAARAANWPGATTFTEFQSDDENTATNAQDMIIAQFVSDALDAQTITGTVTGQTRFGEDGASGNAMPQMMIKVMSGDGSTVRGVLHSGDTRTTTPAGEEPPVTPTFQNMRNPSTGISPVTLSSVTAQAGDRLLIEVGGRLNNTATTNREMDAMFGSSATAGGANDLAAGGTEQTDLNPWVEFSANLTFSGGGGGDVTAPTAPTSLAASDVASPVLTWTQGTDAVGVTQNKIYRSTTSGSGYTLIDTISAATTYTDTTAAAGTTYYYVVTALDAATNESAQSTQDSAITPSAGATAVFQFPASGAITPTTAKARAKVTTAETGAITLKVYSDSGRTTLVTTSSTLTKTNGYVVGAVTGLTANTTYYYGFADGGTLRPTGQGTFKTAPTAGVAASFDFWAASCQDNLSNSTVFTRIRDDNPDFGIHLGDYGYHNSNSTSPADHISAWETEVNHSNEQALAAAVPMDWTWSDHDSTTGGAWSGDAGMPAAQQYYRQIHPAYTLPATGAPTAPIWHTFDWGRVKFFVMDARSASDDLVPDTGTTGAGMKTKIGTEQRTAFLQWLSDNPNAAKIVISAEAWTKVDASGTVTSSSTGDTTEDTWAGFPTERTLIANHITSNSIRNVAFICGDMHSCAFSNGTTGVGMPASTPVFQCSPLDNKGLPKGGPYTIGPFPPDNNGNVPVHQYGFFTVTDTGGANITMSMSARNETGAELSGFSNGAWNTTTATITFTSVAGAVVDITARTSGSGTALATPKLTRNPSARTSGAGTALATPKLTRNQSGRTSGSGTALGTLTVVHSAALSAKASGSGTALATPKLARAISARTSGSGTALTTLSAGNLIFDFTGTNGTAWPSPWSIQAGNGTATIQGNRGRLTQPSANTWGYVRYGTAGTSLSNFDLTGTIYVQSGQNQGFFEVWFRDTGISDDYTMSLDLSTSVVGMDRFTGGTGTRIDSATLTPATSTGKHWRLYANGSVLRAKFWDEGNAEPSAWDLEVTDTNYTTGNLYLAYNATFLYTEFDNLTLDLTPSSSADITARTSGAGTALGTPKLARNPSGRTSGSSAALATLTVTPPTTALTARTSGTGTQLATPKLTRKPTARSSGAGTALGTLTVTHPTTALSARTSGAGTELATTTVGRKVSGRTQSSSLALATIIATPSVAQGRPALGAILVAPTLRATAELGAIPRVAVTIEAGPKATAVMVAGPVARAEIQATLRATAQIS